jgi:predicted ATPase/DNA-binding SARP family transcriptional activator
LALYLLGSPRIELDDNEIHIGRRKALALLAYLAVEARRHRRDTLATLLWPQYSQRDARAELRRTLSVLNRTLGKEWFETDRESAGLRQAPSTGSGQRQPESTEHILWLDVNAFRQRLAACEAHGHPVQEACPDCLNLLTEAVELYRDDFLSGFTLPDAPAFDDWQRYQTQDLQDELASALERLAEGYGAAGAFEPAIAVARRRLELDPLREAAHRQLMRLYAQAGRRTAVLRQYETCVRVLDQELGVSPAAETTALYERLRAERAEPATRAVTLPPRHTLPRQTIPFVGRQSKHNLPQRLTSFIGREKEIVAITDLVTKHRLVMLTGVGGIGKTNLSLQVGQSAVETFPDGVWLVELAPVADPNLVPQVTATAMGLRESKNRAVADYLLDYLQEKQCLLILDNCEHLINGVARFVQTVLQRCANVQILASSREVLGVAGERPFLVPPLTLPKKGQQFILGEWKRYEAVRLFVERAQIVLPDFQVTADNAAALVHICQRLDGIPLALELAAARMKVLTPAQIADRLDDRFRLLTGGSRVALPRQQTLRALIDWSWELLSDAEQLLLQRLSVFVGGITLEAVETVCSGDGLESYECLDLLHELVNKSLLIAKREQGQETHYHLLETIRQYAQEKLAASGSTETFQQRHLTYFRQFAETAAPFLKGPDLLIWLYRLEESLDNIRVALDWAQKTDVGNGLRLIFALTEFCWVRGNIREMEARLGQLLAQTASVSPLVKANGIWLQGWFSGILDHHDKAIVLLEKSLNLYRELEDQAGVASALTELGHALHMCGEIEKGHVALQEAITLHRSLGDTVGTAWSLMSLGEFEMESDHHEQAWECFQESVSLFREAGNLSRFFVVLLRSGLVATEQGDFEVALSLIRESLSIVELLGIRGYLAYVLQDLGKLYFQLGDYPLAQTTFEKSLLIGKETESYSFSYDWTLVQLGYAHLRGGNLAQAKEIFSKSQQQFSKSGDLIGIICALEGLASLAVQQEQPETAVRLFAWADMTRHLNKTNRTQFEQTDVDRDMAHLLEMIDKEAYAAAYAAGQAMTMAQAIAHALGDED